MKNLLLVLLVLTGLAAMAARYSMARAADLSTLEGPGAEVVVVTNAMTPDNIHVFTNLQTAINVVCSNNFGGGTITCGSGEFYRPEGYFFPSNRFFCVRITGQGPGGTWITADTNLFYLESALNVGSEITIDNVSCLYKSTNCGFMFWLDQDSKNTIRNCWLMNYADLTQAGPQEWAHSGVCTVPQGVALGVLGGDNFNTFEKNNVCEVAAGLILGADHYRCIDNQIATVGKYGSGESTGNNWSLTDSNTFVFYGGAKYFQGRDLAVGGSVYILEDGGDTQIYGDDIFHCASGFYFLSPANIYSHRVIHNEAIEDTTWPVLVPNVPFNLANRKRWLTEFTDNYYKSDGYLGWYTMDLNTHTVARTNCPIMAAIRSTTYYNTSRGLTYNWQAGNETIMSLGGPTTTPALSLAPNYSFNGNLGGGSNFDAARLTNNIPVALLTNALDGTRAINGGGLTNLNAGQLAGTISPAALTIGSNLVAQINTGPGLTATYTTNAAGLVTVTISLSLPPK